MIRIVRHFATRLKRVTLRTRSTSVRPALIDGALPAAAWEEFDQWLAFEPFADSLAMREYELASEQARRTVALIGQAGVEVVSRIARARIAQRLVNDPGAQFALAFARERGDAATRGAASVELAVPE